MPISLYDKPARNELSDFDTEILDRILENNWRKISLEKSENNFFSLVATLPKHVITIA